MSKPDQARANDPATPSHDMASADVANGEQPEQPERPEQPESSQHAASERERTGKHPIGEEGADRHREEESPS